MAKHSELLALAFTALIALTSIHAYKTTIYTTTIEEDDVFFTRSSREEHSCSREIQSEQVNDCRRYLTRSSIHGDILEMTVENPRRREEKEHIEQCCQELRNVEQECQCDAVKKAFREAQQWQEQQGSGRSHGSQQQRKILQKAQNLPNECKLEIQQCRIRSPWF